jgi:hypothetical protein
MLERLLGVNGLPLLEERLDGNGKTIEVRIYQLGRADDLQYSSSNLCFSSNAAWKSDVL